MSQSKIKKITFNIDKAKFNFDFVDLNSIFKLIPKDHNPLDNHRLSFYAILIITDKKGKHSINYEDYSYEKGTIFSIRKNSIHKFYKSNARGKLLVFTENFVIKYLDKQYSKKLFQLFNELLTSPKLQLEISDFNDVELLINAIEDEYKAQQDNYSHEIIRSLLHVLMTKLFRIKSRKNYILKTNNYLQQFIAFQELVETHYASSKKVSYYSGLLNITSRTLNNVTHSIVQKSAKNVINDIVIVNLKRLLINSELSINEIAYTVGFSEANNLYQYFKKHTGLSPKQFRKVNR